MKNRVTIHIAGEKYVVLTEESPEYMQQIAQTVDEKISETADMPGISPFKASILAACNLADECCKATETADNLRGQMNNYLRENETLRRELTESQRMLEELTEPKK